MNKEVEKIIQEKIKNKNKKENIFKKIKKWWGNNSYKVFRVILFPVWFFILGKQKLNKYLDSKEKWNEDRVNEILNYFVPRRSGLCFDDEKYLKFFDNGYGWDSKKIIKKYVKRKDRRFFKLYNMEIKAYLIKNFEMQGFKKEVGDCSDGWTEVKFIFE